MTELVRAVQKNISATTSSMETALATTMQQLAHAIQLVSNVIERNTSETQEAAQKVGQTLEIVENVAGISLENAAGIQQISASTSEISIQTRQVGEAAASLAQITRELQCAVAAFSLDEHQ